MWFFLLSLEGNSIFFQWRLYTFQVFVAWKCILYIWLPLMGFLRAEQWPVLLNLTDPSLGYNTKVVYSVRPLWKIQSFHYVLHVLRRQFLSEYITYNFVWLNLINIFIIPPEIHHPPWCNFSFSLLHWHPWICFFWCVVFADMLLFDNCSYPFKCIAHPSEVGSVPSIFVLYHVLLC